MLTEALKDWPDERISFGSLVNAIHGRGFGALLLLISLPCMIPLPIGVSGPVFGGMLCLLSVQMMLGADHPWLPNWMRRIQLPKTSVTRFVARLDPWIMRVEKLCHPSWLWFHGKAGQRISGLFLFVTGIALALPVPLTNVPIALVLAGYGISLIERDGRWLFTMWLASLVIVISFLMLGDHLLGTAMTAWQQYWA